MACDGYEHGDVVRIAPKAKGSFTILDWTNEERDLPLSTFQTATGLVQFVDRQAHELIVRYPGYRITSDAHSFTPLPSKAKERGQNNLAWILAHFSISIEDLAMRVSSKNDISKRALNVLIEGGDRASELDLAAKRAIGFAISALAPGGAVSLSEVFPNDERMRPNERSADA